MTALLPARLSRAVCAGLLLAWIAPAVHAVTVCSVGIGGTGIHQDTGTGGTGIGSVGTGGTGIQADVGIGGTGIHQDTGTGGTGVSADVGIGGTGIVGVITGFGSICVNGIEVEYDRTTPVLQNGASSQASDLKVGQVVEVLAAGSGERVFARHIHAQDAIRGPVTRVDPATRRLEIMHRPVRWEPGTIAAGPANSTLTLEKVRPGEYLRVSGFQTPGGEVVASRIDPAAPGPVRVTGPVSEVRDRQVRLQGLSVELDHETPLAPQQEVTVAGRWQGGGIRDARVEERPSVPFDGRVERVSLQGALGDRLADGTFRFGSSRLTVSAQALVQGGSRDRLRSGDIVQIDGRLSRDNSLRAERVLVGERLPRPDRAGRGSSGRDGGQRSDEDDGGSKASEDRSGSDRDSRSDSDADSREDAGESGVDREPRDTEKREQDSIERSEREARDSADKVERIERDARERIEKIDRDRPEKVEKIEREHVEKIEKVDRSDRDR